jgi:hypothetical protein
MDWRDVQKMKNELFGSETTAIQIFPPESKLVDTANQYYFYVFMEYKFPFGFRNRAVADENFKGLAGTKQRPFDPEHVPEDLQESQQQLANVLTTLKLKNNLL